MFDPRVDFDDDDCAHYFQSELDIDFDEFVVCTECQSDVNADVHDFHDDILIKWSETTLSRGLQRSRDPQSHVKVLKNATA